MRASNDFFVVGTVGLGTALFLMQLLIVNQQILAARNRVQAELAAEETAVPMQWMGIIQRPLILDHTIWIAPPPITRRVPDRYPPPVYPTKAAKNHVGGIVLFTVTVNPDGSVANFKVLSETPRGYGFAAAASEVLPKWRLVPDPRASKSGTTTTMDFHVVFKPKD